MFEHRSHALISRREFLRREALYAAIALGIVGGSLAIGMLGYREFEGMAWIDAFVNAAMLLGGMGPLGELHTNAGKLFAGFYALYCGVVLLLSLGVLAAPVVHRLIHRFHLEIDQDEPKDGGRAK
jgi:hypothetical protein